MHHLETNALRAPSHLFVGLGEAAHATKSIDHIAERSLPHLVFDCRIIPNDVREDGAETNLRQNLADQHLLFVGALQLKHVV
jgi:hypothetical protein